MGWASKILQNRIPLAEMIGIGAGEIENPRPPTDGDR
jgi:hypothetical protein